MPKECCNGEICRTTTTIICLICREQKPVNEVIEGVCGTCYRRYKWKRRKEKHDSKH